QPNGTDLRPIIPEFARFSSPRRKPGSSEISQYQAGNTGFRPRLSPVQALKAAGTTISEESVDSVVKSVSLGAQQSRPVCRMYRKPPLMKLVVAFFNPVQFDIAIIRRQLHQGDLLVGRGHETYFFPGFRRHHGLENPIVLYCFFSGRREHVVSNAR